MRLFLDSSALAKRYIAEPGSSHVSARCGEADEILLSALCVPEIVSGLNRLKREKKISRRQYQILKKSLAADMEQATIVGLTLSVINKTINCLEKASLRTLDAIHIASAMEFGCDRFLTADHRQYEAARQLGLAAEETDRLH